jgi:hypothetical protein
MDKFDIIIITDESTISILITNGITRSNTRIIHVSSSIRIDNITKIYRSLHFFVRFFFRDIILYETVTINIISDSDIIAIFSNDIKDITFTRDDFSLLTM